MTDTKSPFELQGSKNENCEIFLKFFFSLKDYHDNILFTLIYFMENGYKQKHPRIVEFNHRHLETGRNLDISQRVEEEVVLMVPRRCL